jgi:hypothetical protein
MKKQKKTIFSFYFEFAKSILIKIRSDKLVCRERLNNNHQIIFKAKIHSEAV